MVSLGYANADKDFTKIKVASGISIEAWDLQKDDVVYAVKIGTPQKLADLEELKKSVLQRAFIGKL